MKVQLGDGVVDPSASRQEGNSLVDKKRAVGNDLPTSTIQLFKT